MNRVQQIAVQVSNQPGQLAQVGRALAEGGVNIVAILAPESLGSSVLRIVPDDIEKAKRVFDDVELEYTTEEVLSLHLSNRPGQLARLAEELGIASVNIEFLYATTDGTGQNERVILSVSDIDRAEEVLRGVESSS